MRAQARRFSIFMNAFALTMLLAVTTNNVGFMWVAIEATTITSALLIPLHRTKASVEASWKYLLICSVGIALAFAGTVLAYFDFVSSRRTRGRRAELDGAPWRGALAAPRADAAGVCVHPRRVRHEGGPGADAHVAARRAFGGPAPMSAMMSGVLLAVAMYAVARWKAVVDAALGSPFTGNLLLAVGLLSVLIGVFSLVIQRHYKRMLAYSSVEHIGLVSIGLGLGPLGTFAALLHLVNHAVAKSMAFLLAGRDPAPLSRPRRSRGVSGLLRVMPWTGSLFAIGVLALIGLPPFGLFVSEFLLVRAAVLTGHVWVAAAVLVLVLVGVRVPAEPSEPDAVRPRAGRSAVGERAGWTVLALAACAAVSVVLGLALPWQLTALITRPLPSSRHE